MKIGPCHLCTVGQQTCQTCLVFSSKSAQASTVSTYEWQSQDRVASCVSRSKQQDHILLIFPFSLVWCLRASWDYGKGHGIMTWRRRKGKWWSACDAKKTGRPVVGSCPSWNLGQDLCLPRSPMGKRGEQELCRLPNLIKLRLRGVCWWLSTIRWIIDDVGKQNAALMNDELALLWQDC